MSLLGPSLREAQSQDAGLEMAWVPPGMMGTEGRSTDPKGERHMDALILPRHHRGFTSLPEPPAHPVSPWWCWCEWTHAQRDNRAVMLSKAYTGGVHTRTESDAVPTPSPAGPSLAPALRRPEVPSVSPNPRKQRLPEAGPRRHEPSSLASRRNAALLKTNPESRRKPGSWPT